MFWPSFGGGTGRLVRLSILSVILAGIAPAVQAENGEGYVFDVTIAPICLDGTYPVNISPSSGDIAAALTLTTDARGKLSGTLTADSTAYAAKGKIKIRGSGTTFKVTAKLSKKESVTLKGSLSADSISGSAKGKGAFGGATTFDMDVTDAGEAIGSISAVAVPKSRGRLGGTGTMTVCGIAVPIKIAGKTKGKFSIIFKGSKKKTPVSVKGTGDYTPGSALLTLTAKGYGTRSHDAGVRNVDTVLPPANVVYGFASPLYEREDVITANVPTADGDVADTWSITPPLPSGLSMDGVTGVVTGTPDTVQAPSQHTVTAGNLAGTADGALTIEVRENRAFSLAVQPGLTAVDVRHFLNRATWAVNEADVADIQANGIEQYIDEMMVFELDTAWEQAATAEELQDSSDPQGLVPNSTEVARWWSELMMTTESPFQEVLTIFWHDAMPINTNDIGGNSRAHLMVPYINLLRGDGTANFKTLMTDLSRDGAMLRYLDNHINTRTAPNENYAREYWELFTAGVDNGYTQDDIVESAKAFTGWRERSQVVNDYPTPGNSVTTYYFEFDTNRHDVNDKNFLGQTVSGQNVTDDFQAVTDITFANIDVENFISKRLIEWFAFFEPPDELVTALGAVFRNANFEIMPMLKALFMSEAFYSSRARANYIKNPVEFGVGFVRTTGLRIPPNDMDSLLNTLAMRPSFPPVVDGWPESTAWLSAQAMVDRSNLIEHTVNNEMSFQNGLGIDVADLLPPPGQQSAAEVIDQLATLMQVTLGAGERQDLIDYMVTENDGGVIEPSPWDPLNSSMVNERVRGVLYVLAVHPTYQVR